MTPEERKVLEDAEQQAFDTAQAFYDVPTSGIRPPPLIEETETTLDPQLFGFEFGQQPEAEVEPESTSQGGGCADSITLRFDGLSFPCCVFDGSLGSSNIIRIENLNGQTLTLPSHPGFVCDPSQCWWFISTLLDSTHDALVQWFANLDCTDPPFHTSPETYEVTVFFSGGVYYIFVVVFHHCFGCGPDPDFAVVFYAESHSLSGSIPNSFASCSAVINDGPHLDNDFSNCYNDGPMDLTRFAYDGTVTIL